MENLYNKASLVLTPQMVEAGKVYSMKPEDRKGDFTFSRSTAATRVNASGNIEKETQNLLLQSNQFDTSANWVNTSSSETSGHTGYDGSSDAWLLTKSGAGGRLHQNITASGVLTYSVYMKAGASTWGLIEMNGSGADKYVYVNLSTGAKGAVGGGNITEKIEDVGNGWYRISVTASTDATRVRIYPAEENTAGGTSGSVYFQDAQLEQGLVARDVITTTTTAIYGGITDNVPRLDYTDSSCPALLLEPQRTNAVPYSEYFNTGWSKVGCSVTSNAATSPEGLQNATKLVEDTSTGLHMLSYADLYVVGAGDDNYLTLYAKEGERRYLAISSRGNFSNNDNTLIFDTRDGVWANNNSFQNTAQDPVDVGNGWWRIQILNDSSSAAYDGFGIGIAEAGDNWDDASYTGDGTSGIYIWGAQAEAGSYATSYIPTYGSAVTRNGEVCGDAGNASTFNSAEGVLCLEIAALADDLTNRGISITDGTSTNRITFLLSSQSNTLRVFGVSGALQFNLQNSSFNTLNYNKIAVLYQLNNFKFFVNGTQIGSSTSGAVPIGLNSIVFDNGSGGLNFYGKTKQVLYFPTALSDEELAALTTI